MDLDKMLSSQQVAYRIPKHMQSHSTDLIYKINMVKEDWMLTHVTTLQFMGMLWSEVQASEVHQKPRTRAERTFLNQLDTLLETNFKSSHMTRPEINNGLHIEMLESTKRLLVALYFNGLGEDQLAVINEKLRPKGEVE